MHGQAGIRNGTAGQMLNCLNNSTAPSMKALAWAATRFHIPDHAQDGLSNPAKRVHVATAGKRAGHLVNNGHDCEPAFLQVVGEDFAEHLVLANKFAHDGGGQ